MKKMNIYELSGFELTNELKKGGFNYTLTGQSKRIEKTVNQYVESLPDRRLIDSNILQSTPQLVKNAQILYTGTCTPHLSPDLINIDSDSTNIPYNLLLFFRTDDGFRSEINRQLREIQNHSSIAGLPEIRAGVEAGKYADAPTKSLKKNILPVLDEMNATWDRIKEDITIWSGALWENPKTRQYRDIAVPVIIHYAATVNELDRNITLTDIAKRLELHSMTNATTIEQSALFRRQLYFDEIDTLTPRIEGILSVVCNSGNSDCCEITKELYGMLKKYKEDILSELN